MNVSVTLPRYNPSQKLVQTINALTDAGFDDIIVVNDGSKEACTCFFEEIKSNLAVTVIDHSKNMGKGRALKTGFEYFINNRSDKSGVVTTDDDLQHSCDDITACAKKMEEINSAVFGARNFKGKNIPPKSRIGNNITSFTFKYLCGIKITDTQTGLRALPSSYLPILIQTAGERFEYETNMLITMKQNDLKFTEIPIETIYSDNNSGTHFNPFKDSIKIYAVILKYLISSAGASLIDLLAFTLLNLVLPKNMEEWLRIFTATAVARIISSAINYTVNRKKVFNSKSNIKSSLIKYYTLCICQASLSYGLVYIITSWVGTTQSLLQTVYKMAVDIVLFFLCFTVQREWVFKEQKKK
ncbi:MAG: bifunctional glycosyltransferase family 2/GtrA family protein [[Eubacterium] siraeum]|nr:bifunctional glycosyltransferase family 2/GtrA family protein [[Eubacterium] siraeum]